MLSASCRHVRKYLLLCLVVWPCLYFGQRGLGQPARFLPQDFNGWKIETKSIKTGSDPAAVDPTDAPVLKEYGFSESETASYARDGRNMQVKAARFKDATGAFGAFSYYVQPQMRGETIGDKAASNNARILFYKGNILVA